MAANVNQGVAWLLATYLLSGCAGESSDAPAQADGNDPPSGEAESETPTAPGMSAPEAVTPGSEATASADEPALPPAVEIPCELTDPVLEQVVRESLGIPSGPIEGAHLLEELDAAQLGVASLEGIECLSGLTSLDLAENPVMDPTPLAPLVRLEYLNLSKSERNDELPKVADITALAGLSRLRVAHLGGNEIRDLEPLRDHPNLEVLVLSRNAVVSLEPLSTTGITGLHLENNQISDLDPLRGMMIDNLYLSFNSITDIAALAALPNLEVLFLQGNPIEDISPLASASRLRSLRMQDAPVSELQPLADKESLTSLSLVDCNVSDLSPLASLQNLDSLTLTGNLVTEVDAIAALPSLERVVLEDNPLDCTGQQAALAQLEATTTNNGGTLRHDCP